MIRGNFTENWLKEGVSRFLAAGMEPPIQNSLFDP